MRGQTTRSRDLLFQNTHIHTTVFKLRKRKQISQLIITDQIRAFQFVTAIRYNFSRTIFFKSYNNFPLFQFVKQNCTLRPYRESLYFLFARLRLKNPFLWRLVAAFDSSYFSISLQYFSLFTLLTDFRENLRSS